MSFLQRVNNVVTRNLPVKWVRTRLDAPVASITFDDFPRSAWTAGGPILARHDAKATYYVAAHFAGRTEDGLEYYTDADLRAVRDAGHELGCHSFSHQRASQVKTASLLEEADRNAQYLQSILGGDGPSSYAYPFGDVSPRVKVTMSRRFASSRGIRPGVNGGKFIDLGQLRAVPLEQRLWLPAAVDAAIEQARASAGWVIFFTHDVSAAPSPFGCTPEMLSYALEKLAAAKIEILPVKHAMARAVFGSGSGRPH